jgi:hypothetical protein
MKIHPKIILKWVFRNAFALLGSAAIDKGIKELEKVKEKIAKKAEEK